MSNLQMRVTSEKAMVIFAVLFLDILLSSLIPGFSVQPQIFVDSW